MMNNPLSKISINYSKYTTTLSDSTYPQEIQIPPITVNLTKNPTPSTSSNTDHLKHYWQAHFYQQQLLLQNRLQQTTYHWVVHLLTEHPTHIYHPTFGLTSLEEAHTTSLHIIVPRTIPDKVTIIPSITNCSEYQATCYIIQHIE